MKISNASNQRTLQGAFSTPEKGTYVWISGLLQQRIPLEFPYHEEGRVLIFENNDLVEWGSEESPVYPWTFANAHLVDANVEQALHGDMALCRFHWYLPQGETLVEGDGQAEWILEAGEWKLLSVIHSNLSVHFLHQKNVS